MSSMRQRREVALSALLIAPDRELADQFERSQHEARSFQVLADLRNYPARNTLEIRLRQMKPDVVLIDVSTDPAVAGDLIEFLAPQEPAIQVVGLGRTNDPGLVVRTLRQGAKEFLCAPFDVSSQREARSRLCRLRRLDEPDPELPPGRVVVFASAKPGCGSSTVATHTAHALRAVTGERVLLADLDLEGGAIGFCLKLQSPYSVLDALEQSDRLGPAVWSALPANSRGVDVLVAPEIPSLDPIEPARLHDVLEYARQNYHWIVIGAPTIFHRTSLLSVSEAEHAFVISTADLASLHLARRAVNLLRQLGFGRDRYRVVLNRMGKRADLGVSDFSKIFDCEVSGGIPNDYFSLHRVIAMGQPLETDCELGRAIAALARRIAASCSPEPEKGGAPGRTAEDA